ncbi:SDR family NAD(P)-dependent oxidoreductase [Kordiimonas aquimaris]|uniref:SDR family NAD(P)-dependent oxidoreductase n=1 Tax=Kordiimonas aquimaris TaxID=707591 RepID=UPI0021CE853D|nr:SDR family NAD(P)-dependent oxidoreductase [Kordiimonas aquimaris]
MSAKTLMETAFITGAGSGIGRSLAHALVAQGCAIYIADNNAENLAKVETELKQKQANVHARVLDVSNRDDVIAAVEDATAKMGSIDGMFNNAGISFSDMVESMSIQDFKKVMDVDFWGVVHGTQAVLPRMLERGKGHIVNVSSIFGIIGVPSQSAYCAAKHAVKGFNESLFHELKDTDVQVHSVHPGGVKTGIMKNGTHIRNAQGEEVANESDRQEMVKNFDENMAKTTPDEAANVILNGVAKSQYRILVGGDARFIDRMQRWFPNWWRSLLPRLLNRN